MMNESVIWNKDFGEKITYLQVTVSNKVVATV